jgi:hypothetical protein
MLLLKLRERLKCGLRLIGEKHLAFLLLKRPQGFLGIGEFPFQFPQLFFHESTRLRHKAIAGGNILLPIGLGNKIGHPFGHPGFPRGSRDPDNIGITFPLCLDLLAKIVNRIEVSG